MKSNISQADKLVRIAVGLGLGLFWFFTGKIFLGLLALFILATALFNYSPLYRLFGYSTRKFHASPFQAKKNRKKHR